MQEVNFVLGSDPELFLRDIKTKRLRSAIPVIPEGKGEGRPLGTVGNSVLHDNVLIEFNTKPAHSQEEFVQTIGAVLKDIQELVKVDGLEIHLQASADFPKEELNNEEAREFGCLPDYGVYPTPTQNVMPYGAAKLPFRSAGGHLHIGMPDDNEAVRAVLSDPMGKISVVKGLDIFVGIIGVFLDNDPTSPERRALYGKAGCHRPKKYGVEYRATSSWWLASPAHSRLIHSLCAAALATAVSDGALSSLTEKLGGETKVEEIINESLAKEAAHVYQEHLAPLLGETVNALIKSLEKASTAGFSTDWEL